MKNYVPKPPAVNNNTRYHSRGDNKGKYEQIIYSGHYQQGDDTWDFNQERDFNTPPGYNRQDYRQAKPCKQPAPK
jgi:hypothetical protein